MEIVIRAGIDADACLIRVDRLRPTKDELAIMSERELVEHAAAIGAFDAVVGRRATEITTRRFDVDEDGNATRSAIATVVAFLQKCADVATENSPVKMRIVR